MSTTRRIEFYNNYHHDTRKCFLKIDEKIYLCKNNLDATDKTKTNNVWLLNELIYSYFSKGINFPIPRNLLVNFDNKIFFASKFIESSKNYDFSEAKLEHVLPLMQCAILDLCLLNSDRLNHNILVDKNNKLWFIDHDKSMFANGSTDMHRFTNLDQKFEDFIHDYLPNKKLNSIIFSKFFAKTLEELFKQITTHLKSNKEQCLEYINSLSFWKAEDLDISKITTSFNFLEIWWSKLNIFFSKENFIKYYNLLEKRGRLYV